MTSRPEAPDSSDQVSSIRARSGQALRQSLLGAGVEQLPAGRPATEMVHQVSDLWAALSEVTPDRRDMAGWGVFVDSTQHAATAQFDILRTRIMQALSANGWKRVAVTSATHGCGKSFVAANLALSVARVPSARCVLVDLELRQPDLADIFGFRPGPISSVLTGDTPMGEHMRRMGSNLALALNSQPAENPAETLLSPQTAETLRAICDQLDPTAVIIDLPPALGSDDVLSILPQVDAVLLVADGQRTTAEDIRACERMFEGKVPLLGVVLNRGLDFGGKRYRYGK